MSSMKILAKLLDNEFPKSEITDTRNIARALVYDEEGNFAFHRIEGMDIFGDRRYFETPGGGVDEGETLEQAVIRECAEELGYQVIIVRPLGEIDDFYNLIHRENLNHYFLCKRVGPYLGTHFVSQGDTLIKETVWISLCKALELYGNAATTPVARLVNNRESLVIKEAMKDLRGTL